MFFLLIFPEEIHRDCSQLLDVPPLPCSGNVFLLVFGAVTSECRGTISVKWGKPVATRGYYTNFVELRGHTPQPGVKRGDPFEPSCATVPLAATTCQKKQNLRVLGIACAQLAKASELNVKLGQVGARSAGAFCVYPHLAEIPGGIPAL